MNVAIDKRATITTSKATSLFLSFFYWVSKNDRMCILLFFFVNGGMQPIPLQVRNKRYRYECTVNIVIMLSGKFYNILLARHNRMVDYDVTAM